MLRCNAKCWMLQARVSSSMGKCVLCVRRLLLVGCSLAFGASATPRACTLLQGFGLNTRTVCSAESDMTLLSGFRSRNARVAPARPQRSQVRQTHYFSYVVAKDVLQCRPSFSKISRSSRIGSRGVSGRGGVRWPGERNTEYASRRNVVSLLTDQWARRS